MIYCFMGPAKKKKKYAKINKEMETKKRLTIKDDRVRAREEEAAPRMRTRGRRVQEGGVITAGWGQGKGGRENPALEEGAVEEKDGGVPKCQGG